MSLFDFIAAVIFFVGAFLISASITRAVVRRKEETNAEIRELAYEIHRLRTVLEQIHAGNQPWC